MIKLALRNLVRNYRRFLFLGLSISVAFMIITIIQGLLGGMLEQLNVRGVRFYGGEVVIAGYQQPAGTDALENVAGIQAAIESIGLPSTAVAVRTQYMSGNGTVFFQGQSIGLRRIIGLDYERESVAIGRMEYIEGSVDSLKSPRGVMISEVVAKRLGVHVGDEITIRLRQDAGRLDTTELVVGGIFREASIFGYFTAYMDRRRLNALLSKTPDEANVVSVRLADYRDADQVKQRLYTALQGRVNLFPSLGNQTDYQRERSKEYNGIRVGVLTIFDYMYEIQTLISALAAIGFGILVLIFAVIAIGIANTYRMLIYERVREIGTMRALGLQRSGIRNLILAEAFILSIVGIGAGLVLGVLGLVGFASLGLPQVPGLDIMLVRGHLSWALKLDTVLIDALMVVAIALWGAFGPARTAARTSTAEALRTE